MLDKEAYIQRLARHLDAYGGELHFLERLSREELSGRWSKVARQALAQGRPVRRGA
jgi:hypothetical protein